MALFDRQRHLRPTPPDTETLSRPGEAGPADAVDLGFIEFARQRLEDACHTKGVSPSPPTISELEQALGEPVQKLSVLGNNWRNRVYRIEFASGRVAVAKQVIFGTTGIIESQYNQLCAMARLNIPQLRIPKALTLLPRRRLFVMEFVDGKTISGLIWNRAAENSLVTACEMAGRILAHVHTVWRQSSCLVPIESLAHDLARTPWTLSARERNILERALKTVAGLDLSFGQICYDYKPDNLVLADNQLILLDPEIFRQGVQLWDFSAFRSSMRRHLWRFRLLRPFHRRWRALIEQALGRFEHSYLQNFRGCHSDPALVGVMARLFELQRTAVDIMVQKGTMDFARQRPIALGAYVRHSVANPQMRSLHEIEKRWLFRQLEKALS
jgi:hypothetical protein